MVDLFPLNNGIITNLVFSGCFSSQFFFSPVNMRFSDIEEGKSCYKYKNILDGFLCSLKYDKHFSCAIFTPAINFRHSITQTSPQRNANICSDEVA